MEPAVRGVVTWGLSDRYSWLTESDGAGGAVGHGVVAKDNRGLPYDSAYQAKPMYWALLGQLQSSSKTGVAFEGGRAKHQPQAA
jgi:endo-1,4-beta-xylanase